MAEEKLNGLSTEDVVKPQDEPQGEPQGEVEPREDEADSEAAGDEAVQRARDEYLRAWPLDAPEKR